MEETWTKVMTSAVLTHFAEVACSIPELAVTVIVDAHFYKFFRYVGVFTGATIFTFIVVTFTYRYISIKVIENGQLLA